MKSGFVLKLLAVPMALCMLCLSGCEFKTYLKTDKEPTAAITGFFDCLKAKDMEGCGHYLANDSSFEITNSTGFDFADLLLEKQLDCLDYEIIGSVKAEGTRASCFVSITGLDMARIQAAMMEEYPKARSQYIRSHNDADFSTDDQEALNAIMSGAFANVSEMVEPTVKEINLKLEFQRGDWKIVLNDELCAAIFGGVEE